MSFWFRTAAALTLFSAAVLPAPVARAEDPSSLPLLFEEKFEKGADRWETTDPNAWKVVDSASGKAFSLFQQSKYKPTHRSPLNIALIKDVFVTDFVLEAKVLSTKPDYAHRDMCLYFGHQDADHFYYVHLGKKTDDHANQIFIVNGAPRVKISTKTTPGTDWDDKWHAVKIVRRVKDGHIAVYWDDMQNPIMTATDKTFTWGRVGVGSFDDIGDWDDVKLYGITAEVPQKTKN
jgi:hypothetical protein